MKRIVLLFMSALLSFLLFSYIDEYDNLIPQLFRQEKTEYDGLFSEEENKDIFKKFIIRFNSDLYEAYRNGDPAMLSAIPLSDELKVEVAGEIDFLKKMGKVMDLVPEDTEIIKINRLSVAAIQLQVKEKSKVRYLGDKASSAYTETKKEVNYTLIAGADGLMVVGYEVKL